MSNSLLEQLKKSGLVDGKKAEKADKEKRKQAKLARQNKGGDPSALDEAKLLVQKAQAEKIARDRELNQQQKIAAESKAIGAQIKQLIEMNQIETKGGETAFNFTHQGIVQRLYVDEKLREQLVAGRAAIVSWEAGYEVVPSAVAEKIAMRDPSIIVLNNNSPAAEVDADDPYAKFQIPDDLMW